MLKILLFSRLTRWATSQFPLLFMYVKAVLPFIVVLLKDLKLNVETTLWFWLTFNAD